MRSVAGQSGNTPETMVQVLVPAGVHAACPGGSNSRDLGNNYGEAFRALRTIQAHENPHTWYIMQTDAAALASIPMCDVIHQQSCVPRQALLQDTALPPPPPPPARRPSLRRVLPLLFLSKLYQLLSHAGVFEWSFCVLSVTRMQTT